MKIKLFYQNEYHEYQETEKQVNEFIKNVHVEDIKITSESAVNGHSFMIMVIYR